MREEEKMEETFWKQKSVKKQDPENCKRGRVENWTTWQRIGNIPNHGDVDDHDGDE